MAKTKHLKVFGEWGVSKKYIDRLNGTGYWLDIRDLWGSLPEYSTERHIADSKETNVEDFIAAAAFAREMYKQAHPRWYQSMLRETGLTEVSVKIAIAENVAIARLHTRQREAFEQWPVYQQWKQSREIPDCYTVDDIQEWSTLKSEFLTKIWPQLEGSSQHEAYFTTKIRF